MMMRQSASSRGPAVVLLLIATFGASSLTAHAQLFGPESLGGAVLGGVAGGVIGHNNGRRTAEGAAIGAGVGAVLGAIVGNERRATGYAGGYSDSYPTYAPAGPSRAVTGTVLGGIAGGVIGHNNGRRTAEGIAIGAGAGLLLGTLADQEAARRQAWAPQVMPQPAMVTTVPAYPAQPPIPTPANEGVAPETVQEPILLRPIGSPSSASPSMAGANALFGR